MLEKISDFFKEHIGDDNLAITEKTTFAELGLDSLDTFQLVTEFEEEFDITLEIDEDTKTIGDLMKLIESAMK